MIKDLEKKYLADITKTRRDLHQIPEEGLKEFKTQKYIMDFLTSLGLEPKKVASTGVYCFIDKGADESIGFRSDMDGLGIEEQNDIKFKSKHNGMMHACGHDGHMSALLYTIKYLVDNKEKIKKNLLFVFQPAEEGPGGAELVIKSGILEKYNVKHMFAMHVAADIEQGKYGSRPGNFYAASTEFSVFIKGKSAHGAWPQNGVDAIVIASQFINGVQTIVSRSLSPISEKAITIGTIKGGDRLNVIADYVEMDGIIRTLDPKVYERLIQRLKSLAKGLNEAYECEITFDFRPFYHRLYNDKELFEKIKPAFNKKLEIVDVVLSAEDFAYYGEKVPSVFYELGIGNKEKGFLSPIHTPTFNFDEKCLLYALEANINILKILGAYE